VASPSVAGRFDHYICRRDDNLRERAPEEVPRIMAAALRAAGVAEQADLAHSDEQEAITAALEMGQPGDLLLVFADALVRSWKADHQVQASGIGRLLQACARPAPCTRAKRRRG